MPPDEQDEAPEPARMICIEIVATDEKGDAQLDRVAAELGAIMEEAAKQYKYPAGIEYDQMAVVDPDDDSDTEDTDAGDAR
jgi:hypothetical protein